MAGRRAASTSSCPGTGRPRKPAERQAVRERVPRTRYPFIHAYRRLHGRAPAETDIQRFFQVSPPSVHQMLLTLERAGLISRQPGVARSVTLAIDPQWLPELHSRFDQPVKTTVQRI